MKGTISRVALLVVLGTVIATTACTQMPTEKQGVSDMRPQVSFKLENAELAAAQVLIDGLPMGQAGQYVDGVASLRVRPGTHEIQVVFGGRPVLAERFYSADGVNRTFVLK
jgi:hypothetical protein